MQKPLLLCLVSLIVVFLTQLLHGHGGYVDDGRLKRQIAKQTQLNEQLKERNLMMELKIAGLKGSADSLEARARNELNLIKQNEILVILPGSDINQNMVNK